METSSLIWGIVLGLLAAAILSANAYIFVMIIKHKKLQTRGNIFLLSLAFSDFSVALFNIPFTAVSSFNPELRATNSTLCKATGVLEMTFLIASVLSVAAMNFHRYIHIVHWSKYYQIFSIRRICYFVIAMWATALALSIPPLFGLSKICYKPRKSHCFVNWKENLGYTLLLMIACFFVPVILMGYFYARIYSHRKSSKKDLKMMSENQDMKSTITKSVSNVELISLSKSTKIDIVVEHEAIREECTNSGCLTNYGYGNYEQRGEVLEIEARDEISNRNSLDGSTRVIEVNQQETIEQSLKETSKIKNEEDATAIEHSACEVRDSASIITAVVSWKEGRRNSIIGTKDNGEEDFSVDQRLKNNNLQFLPQANPTLNLKALVEVEPAMHSRRQSKGTATRRDATTRREREDRKLTLMCIIIVAVFFISWSPFVVTMLLESLTEINILPVVDKTTLVVGYMNSLANPIIYFYFNRSSRRHFPRLIKRCR